MHLGLVGGIGPAATEYYYHHLSAAHAKADQPLELTIVQADLKVLLRNLAAGDQAAQATVYHHLTKRLQAAGADVVAITSLGGHFCIGQFEAISPLPVVNAIEAVRAELYRRGIRSIGLLGTQAVMESQMYGGLAGFKIVPHRGDNLAAVSREYLAMARAAQVTETQREFFFDAARQLQGDGAEVVLLAGTDLCLAFDGRPCGVPVLDCALAHVDALLELSLPPAQAGS